MTLFDELHRRFRHIAFPALGACVLVYFAYHTIQGDRGLLSLMRVSNEVERAQHALNNLREQRLTLEHRVGLLDRRSLDLDMLEERMRLDLQKIHENEGVIFLTPNS